jgi:plasmid stabilization system protein ParE
MIDCSIHPDAEQDIADAVDFYKAQAGSFIAERFLNEFDRVVELLTGHPGFGTPTTKDRRVFPLKFFPYSIVYRAQTNGIRVLIVRHQHRKPSYAAGRQ